MTASFIVPICISTGNKCTRKNGWRIRQRWKRKKWEHYEQNENELQDSVEYGEKWQYHLKKRKKNVFLYKMSKKFIQEFTETPSNSG